MRRTIISAVMVLSICVSSVLLAGCGDFKYDDKTIDVQAKVLSVNQNILRGKMIGEFLSSASGTVANDVNIVGISFSLGNSLFLEDIEMKHSMLAFYSGKNVLPVEVNLEKWRNGSYRTQLRIDGYRVGHNFFSREGMNELLDREFNVYEGDSE